MTSVSCWADECKWCKNGWCERGSITISDDWECEDFESYKASYTDSFWIACFKDGEKYRRLVKKGKKIEYNGYVFFTKDKITDDELYSLTEARTGLAVGEFRRLKSKDRWDKFVERAATYPDVSTYPIKERSENEQQYNCNSQ